MSFLGRNTDDFNRNTIERELRPFIAEQSRYETSISTSYTAELLEGQERRKNFLPYIGNGKFGLPLDQDSPIYIRGKRALDLQLPYHPIVKVDTVGAEQQSKVAPSLDRPAAINW